MSQNPPKASNLVISSGNFGHEPKWDITRLLTWIAATVGFIQLSFQVIHASSTANHEDELLLVELLCLSGVALIFAWISVRLAQSKWHWLAALLLVPLLYYSIGNALFLLN